MQNLIGKKAADVSPFGRWLNGTLMAVSKGKISVSLELREEFTNPGKIVHGGLISGFIDEVIGMCTFTLEKRGFYVALNLTVDFLKPSVLGDILTAEAEIIKDGKNIAHAECRVYNQNGKLIAKAVSNLMLTQINQ
jgi:acyl-coenzyme A thioesterase 13